MTQEKYQYSRLTTTALEFGQRGEWAVEFMRRADPSITRQQAIAALKYAKSQGAGSLTYCSKRMINSTSYSKAPRARFF